MNIQEPERRPVENEVLADHSTIDITKRKLQKILSDHGVSTEEWGTDEAKSIDNLLSEIKDAESRLIKDGDDLRRETSVVRIDVCFWDKGELLVLVEDHQELPGDRTRERKLGTSVCEKVMGTEPTLQVAERALKQELGIRGPFRFNEAVSFRSELNSPSYPGLRTKYDLKQLQIELEDHQYNPDGYVEDTKKAKTFFKWEKAKDVKWFLELRN